MQYIIVNRPPGEQPSYFQQFDLGEYSYESVWTSFPNRAEHFYTESEAVAARMRMVLEDETEHVTIEECP